MRQLVKICEPGGVILDPFAGSGTTLLAAKLEGYRYLGCELSDHYAALARQRLANHEVDENAANQPVDNFKSGALIHSKNQADFRQNVLHARLYQKAALHFHGRPASAAAALDYIHVLAPHRPLFIEEPVPPTDPLLMAQVTARSPVPVATGERLIGRHEFEPLFRASC